jgi:hypothetical protein
MKKSNNKNYRNMIDSASAVTAALCESVLLKNLVEKLAGRRCDMGFSREKVQAGWQTLETSSIEAHVSGDIRFSDPFAPVNMPFVTSFLFTCIKGNGEEYALTWVSSLS